jgi:uncharacterized protein
LSEVLCHKCSGLCCRYLALPIDKPTNKGDFDDIRWFLAHKGISVFVDEGDWYINIDNRCQHLTKNHRCAIYKHRPRICRGYEHKSCDFQSSNYDYELHLTGMEDLDRYLLQRQRRRKKKKTVKKKK